MPKLPWFPFYGIDFFTDEKVQEMTHAQVGIYLRLLQHQWIEGSIPSSYASSVLKLSIYETAFEDILSTHNVAQDAFCADIRDQCTAVIEHCFVPHPTLPGRLINVKLHSIAINQEQERQRKQAGGRMTAQLKLSKRTPARQRKLSTKTPGANQNQNQNQKERQKDNSESGIGAELCVSKHVEDPDSITTEPTPPDPLDRFMSQGFQLARVKTMPS